MEGSIKDLSQYRFRCACEDKDSAEILPQAKQFKASVNRYYYAIFHCLRAVTALEQFDSSWIVNTFLDNFFKVISPILYGRLIS